MRTRKGTPGPLVHSVAAATSDGLEGSIASTPFANGAGRLGVENASTLPKRRHSPPIDSTRPRYIKRQWLFATSRGSRSITARTQYVAVVARAPSLIVSRLPQLGSPVDAPRRQTSSAMAMGLSAYQFLTTAPLAQSASRA